MNHQLNGIDEERNIKSQDTTSELLDEAAIEYFGKPIKLTKKQYEKALSPLNSILSRKVYGGPNPEDTLKMGRNLRKRLKAREKWVKDRTLSLENAKKQLNYEIDDFISKESI